MKLSTIQHTPALTNGNNIYSLLLTKYTITPDQKPKHKLHLNSSRIPFNFVTIFLGKLRIVPYLRINIKPTHANISIKIIIYPPLKGRLKLHQLI